MNAAYSDMPEINRLYRGVSKALDESNMGRLIPKGQNSAVAIRLTGHFQLDGTATLGACLTNTARAHQIESGLYGGSGISTSRSEKQAVKFATSGGFEAGFVYVIDERLLALKGISSHEFINPTHPHEKEVTLIEKTGGAVPLSVVVEKYEVDELGNRTGNVTRTRVG